MADEWEYNCPQFVDFNTSNATEENSDKWFEYDHEEEEAVADMINQNKDLRKSNENMNAENDNLPNQNAHSRKGLKCLEDVTNSQDTILFSDSNKKLKVFSTVVTTFSSNPSENKEVVSKAIRKKEQNLKGPTRKSPRLNVEPTTKGDSLETETKSTSFSTHNTSVSTVISISNKRTSSSSDKSCNSESSKPPHKVAKIPSLVIPNTPPFMKRLPVKPKTIKSTEELELQRIADLRKELAQHRKLAQDSLQVAIIGQPSLPQLSKRQATYPEEFHFQTDQRIKPNNLPHIVEEKDFVGQLRCNKLLTLKKNLGPTLVKPFNLSESRKRKLNNNEVTEKQSFTSLAAQVDAFQNEIPERFRSRPVTDQGPPVKREKLQMTIAKTPNLMTRHRRRSVTVPSAAKLEEKEIEEMKKYQFRARPLNHKILQAPKVWPKTELRTVTHPERFELETEKRRHIWENKVKEEENKFEFKAQPVPLKILKGPVGIAPFVGIPITVPESPAFATRNRTKLLHELQQTMQAEETKPIIKANPIPHFGVPFKPKPLQRVTVVEPFSFDEKDQERLSKKEEKIKEIIEEETKIPEFRAQPLPNLTPKLPPKQPRARTTTEPFQLEVDIRGEAYQERLKKKLDEELKEMKLRAEFRANPSRVVHEEPFVPLKDHKSFTEFQPIELATEIRHSQRKAFDESIKLKQLKYEAINQEKNYEELSEEKEAIARLRAEIVHKPEPLRHYKPVVITSSNVPLTLPKSPKFRLKDK